MNSAKEISGETQDPPDALSPVTDVTQPPQGVQLAHPDLASLERGTGEAPKGAVQHGAEDRRTKVFLMPGGFYDQTKKLQSIKASHVLDLARLRYALRDQIQFALIGYPDWREMIAAKANFDAVVASALEQILSERDDGPIYMAGHSFGGLVAFATAHCLVEAGRQVVFVGMFDSRLPFTAKSSKRIRKIIKYFKHPDPYLDVLLRLIVRILLELRAFVLLEAFAQRCMSVGVQRIRPQLLFVLRSYAERRWKPNVLSVPTFFFRCEDDELHQSYDCGWNALCSRLTVVPIGGDHRSMWAPANAKRLCASFLEALRATEASGVLPAGTDPASSSTVDYTH
jgi:thioesterase domain-containing protein